MTPELWIALGKQLALLIMGVGGVLLALRDRLKELGAGVRESNQKIEVIGEKVDNIEVTLVQMQLNAVRHDERAVSIQATVEDMDDRLTFIERQR